MKTMTTKSVLLVLVMAAGCGEVTAMMEADAAGEAGTAGPGGGGASGGGSQGGTAGSSGGTGAPAGGASGTGTAGAAGSSAGHGGGGSPVECSITFPLLCNGTCIDPKNDPNNCGGCGNACPVNECCVNSTCCGASGSAGRGGTTGTAGTQGRGGAGGSTGTGGGSGCSPACPSGLSCVGGICTSSPTGNTSCGFSPNRSACYQPAGVITSRDGYHCFDCDVASECWFPDYKGNGSQAVADRGLCVLSCDSCK